MIWMWYKKLYSSNEIGVLTFDSNFEGIEYFKLKNQNTIGVATIFSSRNLVYLVAASNHDENLSLYLWNSDNTFVKIQTLKVEKLGELYDRKHNKLTSSFPNEIISMPMLY